MSNARQIIQTFLRFFAFIHTPKYFWERRLLLRHPIQGTECLTAVSDLTALVFLKSTRSYVTKQYQGLNLFS